MGIAIAVTGIPTAQSRLNAIASALTPEQLSIAMVAAVKIVESAAKANAPIVSGTLRRSILTVPIPGGAAVGTNLVYARRIELGFSGTDSLDRSYDQAPQPYLRPAFDEHRNVVIVNFGKAAGVLLLRAAGV